jgi:hypothetical protein
MPSKSISIYSYRQYRPRAATTKFFIISHFCPLDDIQYGKGCFELYEEKVCTCNTSCFVGLFTRASHRLTYPTRHFISQDYSSSRKSRNINGRMLDFSIQIQTMFLVKHKSE